MEEFFSADILTAHSKGTILLLEKIKKDLLKIYDIHLKYMNIVESMGKKTERVTIGISGDIKKEEEKDYSVILDDSPFFYKYSVDDIKRKEAEKLLEDYDVSSFWLFFYNKRVESLRKNILAKIKQIYSEFLFIL